MDAMNGECKNEAIGVAGWNFGTKAKAFGPRMDAHERGR